MYLSKCISRTDFIALHEQVVFPSSIVVIQLKYVLFLPTLFTSFVNLAMYLRPTLHLPSNDSFSRSSLISPLAPELHTYLGFRDLMGIFA